jgi:nitrile hydratase beta subunit
MDGVHDLGGTDGTGRVSHTPAEPVFHDEFEQRVFAMVLITMAQRAYTMDEFRHAIERMAPAWYLDSSYYEHWLAAMEKLLVERKVVDGDELCDRIEQARAGEVAVPDRTDPETAEMMRAVVERGGGTHRGPGEPAFEAGDTVRVRNIHPEGHTRCPGYVRRAEGTVQAVHGEHVLPDARAHREGEAPEPLYSVRFAGEALWGPDAEANTAVSVDLWESYLRPP